MQTISELLIEKYGFKKTLKSNKEDLDLDKFTCSLRIHVIHYLFYSEINKCFSLGVKTDHPKKDVTGRLLDWNIIMIPKIIYTFKDAENLIGSIVDQRVINTII